jgi:hypothetical protein
MSTNIPVLISWLFVGLSIVAALMLVKLWRLISKLDEENSADINKHNHK